MTEHGIPDGAVRVAPGFYSHNGALHIHAPEYLESLGLPVTPEMVDAVANAALDVSMEMGVQFREDRDLEWPA